jgi:pyridoxine/pyridoxamine 5'-phosphate oxidase
MIAAMAQSGHDPIAKFIRWLEDARCTGIPNYEAMVLATAVRGGKTSVRFVLFKGIDERGFVFFSDARSRKGRELRSARVARILLATAGPAGPRRGTRGGSHGGRGRRLLANPAAAEPACC